MQITRITGLQSPPACVISTRGAYRYANSCNIGVIVCNPRQHRARIGVLTKTLATASHKPNILGAERRTPFNHSRGDSPPASLGGTPSLPSQIASFSVDTFQYMVSRRLPTIHCIFSCVRSTPSCKAFCAHRTGHPRTPSPPIVDAKLQQTWNDGRAPSVPSTGCA